jgi:hypothetical protein
MASTSLTNRAESEEKDRLNEDSTRNIWIRRGIFGGVLTMNFFGYASYSVIAPFFPQEVRYTHTDYRYEDDRSLVSAIWVHP